MKTFISFLLAALLVCAPFVAMDASAKQICTCKHHQSHKHHKRHKCHTKRYVTHTLYRPAYCVNKSTKCGTETLCYDARYYSCRTDYYYHRGRNTARVEICN